MKTCINCSRVFSSADITIAHCSDCRADICQDCEKIIYSSDMKCERRVCPLCFFIEERHLKEMQQLLYEAYLSAGFDII